MDKAENDGATPLSIAAHQGQLEVVPPLCPLQRARTVARRFAMQFHAQEGQGQFRSIWQEADKGQYPRTSRDASHVE